MTLRWSDLEDKGPLERVKEIPADSYDRCGAALSLSNKHALVLALLTPGACSFDESEDEEDAPASGGLSVPTHNEVSDRYHLPPTIKPMDVTVSPLCCAIMLRCSWPTL